MYQIQLKQEKIGTVEANKLIPGLNAIQADLEKFGFTCKQSKYCNSANLVASFNGEEICEYSVTFDRWTATMHITDLVEFRRVQASA